MPGLFSNSEAAAGATCRSHRRLNDGGGERVLAGELQRGRQAKDRFLTGSGQRMNFQDARLPFGQRAGLIDHQRVRFL